MFLRRCRRGKIPKSRDAKSKLFIKADLYKQQGDMSSLMLVINFFGIKISTLGLTAKIGSKIVQMICCILTILLDSIIFLSFDRQ